ncbi:PD-(D/E)XK nuclease family protein [uncultured Roseivirga sp.]|uniref:PDDEXK-like family protein n=1 Tax=uncultured Roseivirga sp. TaxID=543088 RepID=UPI000D78EC78|nr:PD-(D/E)XK nuclease family protein [uncultured Roseivirga sp.]PWL28391.1 MAG: hypothetical protein DCO95_13545 [Roseivirga sp. XM-24bin3]
MKKKLKNINEVEAFLDQVSLIIEHQKERKLLRGGVFNIFSVLGLVAKEDALHSRLLGELLNPKGKHGVGSVFLEYFISCLPNDSVKVFFHESAKVEVEKYIGPLNESKQTGGRIDLLISDKNGNRITVENKIFANDQAGQIKRYMNYNKGKNVVFYLTLYGNEPSEASTMGLKNGEHYFTISYKEEIIQWLELCIKEAVNRPALRETLNQYLMTLKKLTHQIDEDERQEFAELLVKNLEAAETVAFNMSILDNYKDDFRTAVVEALREKIMSIPALKNKFRVSVGAPIEKVYAQVWINPIDETDPYFGIETFNGSVGGIAKGICLSE